jgi:hypothetical protein
MHTQFCEEYIGKQPHGTLKGRWECELKADFRDVFVTP